MEFKISRTSMFNEKPCSEAVQKEVDLWDTRTCTEEYFNDKNLGSGAKWRERGSDHKVLDNGHITRRIGTEIVWVIEINSLDELIAFSNKYGSIIFNSDEIEIYDDYRE